MSTLHFLVGANHYLDRSAVWAAIGVVIALPGLYLAYGQLRGIQKTSRADFAKRFIDTFFTEETRTLFTLLLNSALEFSVVEIRDKDGQMIDRMPCLRIKKDVAEQLKGIVPLEDEKTGYSAFEVDDLLLGFFDDLGWYERRNLIDFDTIEQAFGYYIMESYRNQQIQQYLAYNDNKGQYEDFRYIYKKVTRNTENETQIREAD